MIRPEDGVGQGGEDLAPELTDVRAVVEAASAGETARITATLIRVTGDWGLAEDRVQDAFARTCPAPWKSLAN